MIKITDGIVRNPEWRMSVPVNLEICDGEQIAICGDNAAGKTRLVEIITGHYPLLQDQVRFNFDTRVSHVDRETGVRRMVSEQVRYITFRDSYGEQDGGYYLQQRWNRHSVDDDMPTVGHVLAAVAERRPGMRDQIYRTFGIRELLDKQILSLSSGELRKLQLAKTLLADPKVLIVDNPFIGLDAGMRTMLQDLLAKITRETTLQVILVVSSTSSVCLSFSRDTVPAVIAGVMKSRINASINTVVIKYHASVRYEFTPSSADTPIIRKNISPTMDIIAFIKIIKIIILGFFISIVISLYKTAFFLLGLVLVLIFISFVRRFSGLSLLSA